MPLALLDDPGTGGRLAAALAERAALTDARTVNRELSALRSAVGWWRGQGWISADPTAGLRHRQPAVAAPPLAAAQVSDLFGLAVSLREQALWRVLYDSGAPAAEVLALDAHQLDLSRHRVRARAWRRIAGRHRVAGGDQPDPALAAVRPDLGAGVPDRPQGAGRGPRRPTSAR